MKRIIYFFICTLISIGVFAQEITLKGVVTAAEDGLGLPGVTIAVKGTTNGTITDFDGNYALDVPTDAIVVYSFVGMKSQEITVGGRTQIDVVLENFAFDVDEVVVVGYGVQKKVWLQVQLVR